MSLESPDMFSDPTEYTSNAIHPDDIAVVKADLKKLSEEEFQFHYKATKNQYAALISTLEALMELQTAMREEVGPYSFDTDFVSSVEFLREDILYIMEQMMMISYWEQESR